MLRVEWKRKRTGKEKYENKLRRLSLDKVNLNCNSRNNKANTVRVIFFILKFHETYFIAEILGVDETTRDFTIMQSRTRRDLCEQASQFIAATAVVKLSRLFIVVRYELVRFFRIAWHRMKWHRFRSLPD